MRNARVWVCLVLVVVVVAVAGYWLSSRRVAAADSEVERAALAGDWQKVVAECGSGEELDAQPVLRALKGHACLALNRNNESLALLLSVSDEASQTAWREWTESFAKRHRDSAIADYLKGDALARCSDWEGAIEAYGQALEKDAKLVLARNARGAALATQGRWDKARKDLEVACEATPPLADAYASFGTLQVARQAPEGALASFTKALEVSPQFALALNGSGCAYYGLGNWEEANRCFAEAARQVPLPPFLANLRALGVAAESFKLPGLENSPLFRYTDFLDWQTLRAKTTSKDDVLHTLLGAQLPEELTRKVLARLNAMLDDPTVYEKIKDKVDLATAPARVHTLMSQTAAARCKACKAITPQELAQMRLLNRLLIELAYPSLIAKHDARQPGMQLTLTHGLMDQMEYKESLTLPQIAGGQWNMDHLFRPMADALETSRLPVVSFLGKQWNDHLDFSTHTNELVCSQKWNIGLDTIRPGGVSADLRRAYVDKGEWPVASWFGLVHPGISS